MNEKRLIDLAISDNTRKQTGTYFGYTLTSILGDPRPTKALVRSLECTRLNPARSRRCVQTMSARSKVAPSGFSHRSPTASLSRAVSAVSRSSSAASAPDRALSKGNHWSSVPEQESAVLCTHLRCCQSGLTVWTLENKVLQQLSINEHGCFHQENCYMVFQSDQDNGSSFLHVWFGSQSIEADHDTIITSAEEFDKSSAGASFVSLEYEEHETARFLRHFQDGIIVVEGKYKQYSRNLHKCVKRLYKVVGRAYPSATFTECSDNAATENDILILDGYPRMYVWIGKQTDFVRRVKAIRLAKMIRTRRRNGMSHIVVVEQDKNKQMSDAFLNKLKPGEHCEIGGCGETAMTDVNNYKPCLYKVNGERVLYDMPLVAAQPLRQKYLTGQDSFLLDMGPSCPLYIWVGNGADSDALYNALHFAMNFKQHHNRPYNSTICRVREGNETVSFKRAFIDWKSRVKKIRHSVNNEPTTKIGKILYSQRGHHIDAKLDDSSSDDQFQIENGTTEIWQVNGDTMEHLPGQDLRVFYNHCCYILLYRKSMPDQFVIYFWVGCKTSIKDQVQAEKLALSRNSLLQNKATIIRVTDGREPYHFFKTVQGSIIVYDIYFLQDSRSSIINNAQFSNSTLMLCVQELESECVRVSQVSPVSTSLNSAAVYVVIIHQASILWYGKKSSAHERECSKYIFAYFCPERLHDYEIIIEGREPVTFWSVVQHTGDHPKQLSEFKLPRHFPTLALCSRKLAAWSFTDIPDFSKEDLCETEIFILDTHDQILLWIGSDVVETNQETLSRVTKTYIDLDPAGRKDSDLQLLFCYQGYEPSLFRKYFRGWNQRGYGGKEAYEAARKQLRQENACINLNCQYLSDREFKGFIKMTRADYNTLPIWKQSQTDIEVHKNSPFCLLTTVV